MSLHMWSWCCTSADLQISSAVNRFSWVLCSSFWHGRFHPNSQRKFHPNTGINHYDHYVYICLHSWVQMTVRTPLKYVLSPVSRNVMQSLVSSYIHLYTVGEKTIMIVKFCHHDLQMVGFDIFWPFPPILAQELRSVPKFSSPQNLPKHNRLDDHEIFINRFLSGAVPFDILIRLIRFHGMWHTRRCW